MGRPSKYTPELGTAVAEAVADGKTLRVIAAEPGMPSARTIIAWTIRYPEFREKYEQARVMAGDVEFDAIRDLAASAQRITAEAGPNGAAAIAAIREEIKARQWVAGRLNQKYGDKVAVTGPGGTPLIPSAQDPARLAHVLAVLAHVRDLPGPVIDQQKELPAPEGRTDRTASLGRPPRSAAEMELNNITQLPVRPKGNSDDAV